MSRFKHWSKSLVQPIGRHVWPLSAPNQTKSWLNMKLCQVIVCTNLVSSTLIWPQNTICVYIYNCLSAFTTIHLYLALYRRYYPYLVIFALILPYVPYAMYSSIEKIIHGDIALKRIWGSRKCWHECSLCVYLVIDQFWVDLCRVSFGCEYSCSRVLRV